jgi:hypothetical protein
MGLAGLERRPHNVRLPTQPSSARIFASKSTDDYAENKGLPATALSEMYLDRL